MRVATWNVNGLRARQEYVLHWLRSRQPDVVGLQELKMRDEQFPASEFEAAGYTAVTHGQKSWNGVAVLAREAMDVRQVGLPGQEDSARDCCSRVGGLSFTTVLCPMERTGAPVIDRKLAWPCLASTL